MQSAAKNKIYQMFKIEGGAGVKGVLKNVQKYCRIVKEGHTYDAKL